jgi:1,4-alpha-glucan branching enzyme
MSKYEEINFVDTAQPVWNYSLFTEADIHAFQHGTHSTLYQLFGNKQIEVLGVNGTYFSVWAPNATAVFVKGNFNNWSDEAHPLKVRLESSGIWEGFIPNIGQGEVYKYHIHGYKGMKLDKGDPYAHYWELRPLTASITWQTNYQWKDAAWLEDRKIKNRTDQPYSVYEVHLASWMRPDKTNENSYNSYLQLIDLMVPYVKEMGFTHVEFMPVMEHPFDGSWGYQGVGFFAPTSRFGNPQEFAALVDAFHQAGIGVILDWVPSHFPYDSHGLFMFDGANTYEYADMRKGYHPDWNSYIFNYKRGEVKSFLISSAKFWCDQFHIDALRVDAVSSMLRLDYSREAGAWEPNEFGGNGNIEAIEFIKDLNITLYRDFPAIQTIAEEASDWPGISQPVFMDGLGFGMKWMMGWMHDTLDYFKLDPIMRSGAQDKFSFSMMYYYDEHFMLPLSHDEVVHGKSPMLYKMPGDEWQKFANLRLMYAYMFTHPGAKLLFMGNEFAATKEWDYQSELQWDLLSHVSHGGMKFCVQQLNALYKAQPALFELQYEPEGFEWVETNKRQEGVIAFKRKGKNPKDEILVVFNMTPVPRHQFPIHVAGKTVWTEIFNSDDKAFWGVGDLFNKEVQGVSVDGTNDWKTLLLELPALGAIVLK